MYICIVKLGPDFFDTTLICLQDLHMVNLDEFKYGGTNLTAFRLLDPERAEVKQVVEDWIYGEMRYGRKLDTSSTSVKVR